MSTVRSEQTEFGEVEFETVECDSCQTEVPKDETYPYKLDIRSGQKGSSHISSEWIDKPKIRVCEFCREESEMTIVELYEDHYHRLRDHRDRLFIDHAKKHKNYFYYITIGFILGILTIMWSSDGAILFPTVTFVMLVGVEIYSIRYHKKESEN